MWYGAITGTAVICAVIALARFYKTTDYRWRTVALWLYITAVVSGAAGAAWMLIRR